MAYNETPTLPERIAMLNIVIFLARLVLALILVKWIARFALGLFVMIQYAINARKAQKLNQTPETA